MFKLSFCIACQKNQKQTKKTQQQQTTMQEYQKVQPNEIFKC